MTGLLSLNYEHIKCLQPEIRLEAFQQLIHKNLAQFTTADKRAVLSALATRIAVTNGDIEIKSVIPQNLIIIGQTSGCMLTHNKNHRSKVAVDWN